MRPSPSALTITLLVSLLSFVPVASAGIQRRRLGGSSSRDSQESLVRDLLLGTPDGLPPSIEELCSVYNNVKAKGICIAYCEAQDCHLEEQQGKQSCEQLQKNFFRLTGIETLPCEDELEPPPMPTSMSFSYPPKETDPPTTTAEPLPTTTISPTIAPVTQAPTSPPPTMTFDVDWTCIPQDDTTSSCGVDDQLTPTEQCSGRPTEMTFLYTGLPCEDSSNTQFSSFICNDYSNSGSAIPVGTPSYIVVVDLNNEAMYYTGWVEVGSTFTVSDGGNRIEADLLIFIANSDDISNQENYLQGIQFHSSCSTNLFLYDRYGAVTVGGWVNDGQGVVSAGFRDRPTQLLQLTIPASSVLELGPSFTLTSLMIATNINGVDHVSDLSSQLVRPLQSSGEDPDAKELQVEFWPPDLFRARTYELRLLLGAADGDGENWLSQGDMVLVAGYSIPNYL